ncbi:DUF4190 domain-containing protein [Nocardia vermiculata]|uniref:DUF4190 domain-containing protein n=1 Tax=Nocardia vermiculata TaxID=257274 RepID=A0A846Y7R6_9NOCA|nr:DUF4190 domain-containing protein [Nocardia vermiculata]NKY53781.1 DUF4190 domain-containing protein [Nocardia vermiculata]
MTENPPPGSYPPPENYPRPEGESGGYPPPPGSYPPPSGNYPPPPGGYPGGPGDGAWQQQPQGKGLAITALILGIIALLFCWTVIGGILLGLAAVIVGIVAVVKARRGTAGGGGMAIAGLILGLLGLIAGIVIVVVAGLFFVNNGGRDFVDCVNDAGNDQSKIDQCQRDWNKTLENKYSVTINPQPTQ